MDKKEFETLVEIEGFNHKWRYKLVYGDYIFHSQMFTEGVDKDHYKRLFYEYVDKKVKELKSKETMEVING